MRRASSLGPWVAGALALICALQLSHLVGDLADRWQLPQFEPGQRRFASLSLSDKERLASFDEEIRLTYLASRRETLPAHLAQLEERVRDVLGAFERSLAENGQPFSVAVVYPDDHPDWQASLASAGMAPWRARRVEGDGYRDDELWSSLRIGYGPRPAAVFNGVGPDRVDRLQELILAQLEELRRPRRPRVAIDAPPGFDDLRTILRSGAELIEVDFDTTGELPEELDLFVWLDPEHATGQHLATLEALRATGGNLIFGGNSLDSEESWAGSQLRASFTAGPRASHAVLEHFGLTPVEGLLLDPQGAEVVGPRLTAGETPAAIAPWLVRSTPNQHDFRTLRGQPNGSLLFRTPTAFLPDRTRLAELSLEETVLAGASEYASAHPLPDSEVALEEVLEYSGRSQPNASLCAILRPTDPWGGRLVMLADSALLADQDFRAEHYAHSAFLEILLSSLLSSERVVASRIALTSPEILPEFEPATRAWLRVAVVLTIPGIFALLFLLRRERRAARARSMRSLTPLLSASVAAILAVLASRLTPAIDVDLTREGRNRLTADERLVFSELLEEPVELELCFSPAAELPAEFKPLARETRRTCQKLAREFKNVSLRELQPQTYDTLEQAELAEAGISRLLVSTTSAEVTRIYSIYAHLLMRRGARTEVLEFPSQRSFQALRFRLAHALERLDRGKPTQLALYAQPPRISPAEATLEYQRKGLFAPRESDVFSELEELLEEYDFKVTRLNPAQDEIPVETDAVLWLQPRRDVLPMLARLGRWLHAGGAAMVAGQHFRILSRQLERAGLQQRFWPQPQFLDLEKFYLPELGIELERELVFDSIHASHPVQTRVDSTDGTARYVDLETTQPFLVSAGAGAASELGQLLLPFPTRVQWDTEELASRGLSVTPWVTGSDLYWTFAWTGGDLTGEVLRGELSPEGLVPTGLQLFEEPATYAAMISGSFPTATLGDSEESASPTLIVGEEDGDPSARLLLVGNSRLFENQLLNSGDYDHELFALRAAADLSLAPALAAFLDRSPGAPVIEPQEESTRLAWRLIVLGGFPFLLLMMGALRRLQP